MVRFERAKIKQKAKAVMGKVRAPVIVVNLAKARAEALARETELFAHAMKKQPGHVPLERTPIGWTDRIQGSATYAGIRRGVKVAGHVVGWTALVALPAMLSGTAPITAIAAGAKVAMGGSVISMAVSKERKARAADNGTRKTELVDVIMMIVFKLLDYFTNRGRKP